MRKPPRPSLRQPSNHMRPRIFRRPARRAAPRREHDPPSRRTKFVKTADAFRTPRREGPQTPFTKRPRTFLSPLASITAVETSKHRLSREFGSLSIFDFSTYRRKADIVIFHIPAG